MKTNFNNIQIQPLELAAGCSEHTKGIKYPWKRLNLTHPKQTLTAVQSYTPLNHVLTNQKWENAHSINHTHNYKTNKKEANNKAFRTQAHKERDLHTSDPPYMNLCTTVYFLI